MDHDHGGGTDMGDSDSEGCPMIMIVSKWTHLMWKLQLEPLMGNFYKLHKNFIHSFMLDIVSQFYLKVGLRNRLKRSFYQPLLYFS